MFLIKSLQQQLYMSLALEINKKDISEWQNA